MNQSTLSPPPNVRAPLQFDLRYLRQPLALRLRALWLRKI